MPKRKQVTISVLEDVVKKSAQKTGMPMDDKKAKQLAKCLKGMISDLKKPPKKNDDSFDNPEDQFFITLLSGL